MFTVLDLDLALERRADVARRVNAARPEMGPQRERKRRGSRWSSRFVRLLRAPSGAAAPRSG